MSLQSLLKKLQALRSKVRSSASYDKKNVADKVRGPQANDMLTRNKKDFDKVLRTEDDLIEADLDKSDTSGS